jgi:phosphoribosylformylglycinamidine synthase
MLFVLAERAHADGARSMPAGESIHAAFPDNGTRGELEEEVKAKIHVTLKPGILDPQGKAIEHALETLGFNSASNVRVGKYMELEVQESAKDKAEAQVKAMCEKLLANTIIEEYRYELQ